MDDRYHHQNCDTCAYHHESTRRIDQLEKRSEQKDQSLKEIREKLGTIETQTAVLQQKFDNIRVPIWIIFAAVLAQIGKWIFTFGPVAKGVAQASGLF